MMSVPTMTVWKRVISNPLKGVPHSTSPTVPLTAADPDIASLPNSCIKQDTKHVHLQVWYIGKNFITPFLLFSNREDSTELILLWDPS